MAIQPDLMKDILNMISGELSDSQNPPKIEVYNGSTKVATITGLTVNWSGEAFEPVTIHGEDDSSNEYDFDTLKLLAHNGAEVWAVWTGNKTHKGANDKLVVDWTISVS